MINSLIISNSLLSSKSGHERLFVDIEISRLNSMLYGTVPLKKQIQGIHNCLPCVEGSPSPYHNPRDRLQLASGCRSAPKMGQNTTLIYISGSSRSRKVARFDSTTLIGAFPGSSSRIIPLALSMLRNSSESRSVLAKKTVNDRLARI